MLNKTRGLTKIDTSLNRDQVILALRGLAQEWKDAGDGESLLTKEASVGLILYDVAKALGLTYHEQEQILRSDLFEIKLATGDPVFITA